MNFSKVFILIMGLTLSYLGASGSALAQAPDANFRYGQVERKEIWDTLTR
jgi:hypothetical protein